MQLPLITKPSIAQIMNYLSILKGHDGILVLDKNQDDNNMSYKMILYSHNGIYMILLEKSMEDGDIEVRTFYNKNHPRSFIFIFGEPYPEASTTKNFPSVIEAFKEFYETGDVSRGLLD